MKTQKNRTLTAIALVLVLIITSFAAGIPVTNAQKIQVGIGVSTQPKIVGIGNSIWVNTLITPMPNNKQVYEGLYCTFTKPDMTTDTLGPLTSLFEGTMHFQYTPDKLGDWSVQVTWEGDETRLGADSEVFSFTVQEEPLPPHPGSELPTGYWERPINAENREWNQISGGWYVSGYIETAYNSSRGAYNPYSTAPNTAHVLWKHQPLLGGIIGGDFESSRFQPTYTPSVYPMIMGGRCYYIGPDGIHCLDERTGEELWHQAAGTGDLTGVPHPVPYGSAPEYGKENPPQPMINGYLYTRSSGMIQKFDGGTGALLEVLYPGEDGLYPGEGKSFGKLMFDLRDYFGYVLVNTPIPGGLNVTLAKFNILSPGTFEERTVWETPAPYSPVLYGDLFIHDDTIFWGTPGVTYTMGWDLQTGAARFNITREFPLMGWGATGYGNAYWPSSVHRAMKAFDLHTGQEVWTSEPAENPWGAFWAYSMGVAYDKVYGLSYDGHLYAYDAHTGETVWKFYSGDTPETPYGTWPFWGNPAIADGKIYAGTGEHTPTQPMIRGCKLYCLDANTGDEIWNIRFGAGGGKVIADGTLFAASEYQVLIYAFDKGQTAITTTVPDTVQPHGTPVLIKGMITDQSPAQPGTACIADEDMTEWMEYLHMQQPMPADLKGVEVQLTTLDPNGNTIDIGTVTSDMTGMFKKMWTPEVPGAYTVMATFMGTESYWPSFAETALGVVEVESTPPPETPETMTDTYLAGSTIAIIAAIAIAVLLLLRRK